MIGLLKRPVWESVGSSLVGRPRKRWIDSVNDCLKKRGQASMMVYDKNEWWEFVRGECLGHRAGDEPLTLTRCYSCGLSLLYETLRGGG